MTASPEFHSALIGKFIRRTAVSLLFVGVVLFGAAGTLNWPEAWLYLALASAISFGAGWWMARNDPALLSERLRSPFQREQKPWDKAVMAVMLALWIGWLILMGLDQRYHWSNVPTALKAIGLALIALGRGEDSNGARSSRGNDRALRSRQTPDLCRGTFVHRGRAPPPRFLVGACCRARPCLYYRGEGCP